MFNRLILPMTLLASLLGNGYLFYELLSLKNEPTKRLMTLGEPIVMRTVGGLLEVSVVNAIEFFETRQNHTILSVPVGHTVSSIRVPATYRYHIELAPEWKIFSRGEDLIVIAPSVKPSLPVAIDTGKLEWHTSGVWSLVTGNALKEKLQRSITSDLATKAKNSGYVQLQREHARKTVHEFVQKWALRHDRFKQLQPVNFKIYFADERLDSLLTH